ncbi:DUF1275 family protein [Microbacterium lacticum]
MVRSLSRRGFAAAVVLSMVAGYVDGFGFVSLGGYFVSFLSGNTTRASVDLAGLSLGPALFAGALILAFVAGAAVGTAVPGGRMRGETRVLIMIVLLISAAAVTAALSQHALTGALLAFAMGALNTVFARGG